MALKVTLMHSKKLDDGRYRYRRRFPENVRTELGWEFIRTSAEPLSDQIFLRWHQSREIEFAKAVRSARRFTSPMSLSNRELFDAAQDRADQLLQGIIGLDDDEARAVLAESFASKYPLDPETGDPIGIAKGNVAMISALMEPHASTPEPTMADAKKLYLSENVGDPTTERGRKNRNDTDRVFRLAEEALGDRANVPLTELGNADARAVRDHMLKRTKAGKAGETIKPSSVRRELNVLDRCEDDDLRSRCARLVNARGCGVPVGGRAAYFDRGAW